MMNFTKVTKTKFDNLAKTPLTASLNANMLNQEKTKSTWGRTLKNEAT